MELVFTDGKLHVDGYDFSGDANEIRTRVQAPAKPASRFGTAFDQFLPGPKRATIAVTGCWNAAAAPGADKPDNILSGNIALIGKVLSAWPTGADGEIGGIALQSVQGSYAPLEGRYGEVLPFNADFEVSTAPVLLRPTLLHPATARTVTGNGVARQVGAVSATQKLYAFLQVLAVSGAAPTLDVKVQSDDAVGFATPTDRITFAQQAARGAVWAAPVDGAIADDYWRVNYTIGGAGPSFTFIVGIAIL